MQKTRTMVMPSRSTMKKSLLPVPASLPFTPKKRLPSQFSSSVSGTPFRSDYSDEEADSSFIIEIKPVLNTTMNRSFKHDNCVIKGQVLEKRLVALIYEFAKKTMLHYRIEIPRKEPILLLPNRRQNTSAIAEFRSLAKTLPG